MNNYDLDFIAGLIKTLWFGDEPISAIYDRAVSQNERGVEIDLTIGDDEGMAEDFARQSVLFLLGNVIRTSDPRLYNTLLEHQDPES